MLPQNEEGFFPNNILILAKRYGGYFQIEKVHFQVPSFEISIFNAFKVLDYLQLEVLCFIYV
jgi:hypothetical protein